MREYLIKRILLMIPTLLGITLVVYAVLLLLPGDPVDVLLGQEYDEKIAKQLRAEWGLDDPIIVQYGKWLWHIVRAPTQARVVRGTALSIKETEYLPCQYEYLRGLSQRFGVQSLALW